jgi:hypothetical protein
MLEAGAHDAYTQEAYTMPSKTSPRVLATQQRRAIAVGLRTRGATYAQIEQVLRSQYAHLLPPHYNIRRAYEDVSRALVEIRHQLAEDVETVRRLELERLDELQLSIWPAAQAGDLAAIHTVLRLMERRARLMNLDAPRKYAQTTPEGTPPAAREPPPTGISEVEWVELLATHSTRITCPDD